jgi:hypothetical protein
MSQSFKTLDMFPWAIELSQKHQKKSASPSLDEEVTEKFALSPEQQAELEMLRWTQCPQYYLA